MSEYDKYNNLTINQIKKEIDNITELHHSERKVSNETISKEFLLKNYLLKLLKNKEDKIKYNYNYNYNYNNNNRFILR